MSCNGLYRFNNSLEGWDEKSGIALGYQDSRGIPVGFSDKPLHPLWPVKLPLLEILRWLQSSCAVEPPELSSMCLFGSKRYVLLRANEANLRTRTDRLNSRSSPL